MRHAAMVLFVVLAAPVAMADGPGPAELEAGAAGAYTPPACVGLFADVPCTAQFAAWVEQFARDGITSGCTAGNYCPDAAVTRRQMAVFVERAMRGTATWPPLVVNVTAVLAADGSIDTAASGQALLDAVAAIPSTGPGAPSGSQRYVVKVGPGRFDLSQTLVLRDWVSIEGSGWETELFAAQTTGTINTGWWSRVSDMSIYASASSGTGIAIFNDGGHAVLNNVYVSVSGTLATNYTVYNLGSNLDVTNSTIVTNGSNVSYGIYTTGTPRIINVRDTRVYGQQAAINNAGAYGLNLMFNRLQGPLLNTGGTYRCFSNCDENFVAKTCP